MTLKEDMEGFTFQGSTKERSLTFEQQQREKREITLARARAEKEGLEETPSVPDVPVVPDVPDVKTPLDPPIEDVREWWGTYILPTNDTDLDYLSLWTLHTHLTEEVRSTPRVIISSIEPGSGKTTVLEHMEALSYRPQRISGKSSPALLARLTRDRCTLMIDEADKSLSKGDPASNDVFDILNTGYKMGGKRPVLVPRAGGDWEVDDMSTFAPAIITGNNPYLPEDTRSRSVTIVLLKDVNGEVQETDWYEIEDDAKALKACIEEWADSMREQAQTAKPVFPEGFTGRLKELWRPILIVADLLGGEWPDKARAMAIAYKQDLEADQEAGYTGKSKDRHLLEDIHAIWDGEAFLPTEVIVERLKSHNGYYAPEDGKPLTTHRFGISMRGLNIRATQTRFEGSVKRGYEQAAFTKAWSTFGLTDREGVKESGTPGTSVTPGTEDVDHSQKPSPSVPADPAPAPKPKGEFVLSDGTPVDSLTSRQETEWSQW